MQRVRLDGKKEGRRVVLRAALKKAAPKEENKRSKKTSFNELCRDADANPWGEAYRVAMAKTEAQLYPLRHA